MAITYIHTYIHRYHVCMYLDAYSIITTEGINLNFDILKMRK